MGLGRSAAVFAASLVMALSAADASASMGDAFVVYATETELLATRIAPDGTARDAPGLLIDRQPSNGIGNAAFASTASGWIVAWTHHTKGVFARRIGSDGRLGAVIRVADIATDDVTVRGDVYVAAVGDDAFVVCRPARVGTAKAWRIGGAKVGVVAHDAFGLEPVTGLAADGARRMFAVVTSNPVSQTVHTRGLDGDLTFVPISLDERPTGRPGMWHDGPQVAAGAKRDLLVSFTENDRIIGVLVDPDSGATRRGTLATLSATVFRHVIAASAGGYLLVWVDMPRRGPRTMRARWLPASDPFAGGRDLAIASTGQVAGDPYVSASGGGFVISWTDETGRHATRVDGAGVLLDAQPLTPWTKRARP